MAKWTHAHITQAGFSEWQATQGAKGGKKSKGGGRKTNERSARQSKPWESIGISKATYYRNKQKTTD